MRIEVLSTRATRVFLRAPTNRNQRVPSPTSQGARVRIRLKALLLFIQEFTHRLKETMRM